MTIHRSTIAEPPLPKQSLFHYLFPETDPARRSPVDIPPDSVALIDALTDRRVTRGEFIKRCRSVAAGLRQKGLNRGDVVGLMGLNSIEWMVAFHASHCAGLRVSPVNWA